MATLTLSDIVNRRSTANAKLKEETFESLFSNFFRCEGFPAEISFPFSVPLILSISVPLALFRRHVLSVPQSVACRAKREREAESFRQ